MPELCTDSSMSSKIVIRTAELSDAEALAELEQLCFPEEPWNISMISDEIENPQTMFVLAEESEEGSEKKRISGALVAWLIPPYECQIGSIAVAPHLRRRKLGSEFLSILADVCKELKIEDILLEVRVGNKPALGLYESFGFVKTGLRKKYYSNGEDAWNMLWHRDLAESGEE